MDKWFDDKFEKRNFKNARKIDLDRDKIFYLPRRRLSITNWLIITNILVYLFLILIKTFRILTEAQTLDIFALQANAFFSGKVWQVLTSMFTHLWLPHLIFNMISLFFVGSFLERIIGRKKFLWFYIVSGIFAGVFYSVLSFYLGTTSLGEKIFVNPNVYSIGASGAIFGLAGLLAVLTPFMKVYLIAGPVIALIINVFLDNIISSPEILNVINLLIMFYIFLSIFSIFSFNSKIRKIALPIEMSFWILPIVAILPLIIISLFVPLPIGNTAHLGGLISGLIYGTYLKNKYKIKTALLKGYFK